MIKPVNGHLLIEPIAHDSFMASQSQTYQEIGTVIDVAEDLGTYSLSGAAGPGGQYYKLPVNKGDKVYFDSWLAAKYPKNKEGDFYWLVKWEDVRAIENA